ncbi:MAG: acetyl-CoA decarbonylase/synthase complex subunit alpha [Methanosarcina sp. 795]|uniref:Acetyl-CoA decarbonylase/synthase complex subunit alpha n=1 Tax=Methanosarcina thermophila TaxID=2210 RepID=A0A3G9CSM7_METTE|nr:MAG: acetyl-CoA decarbonylase/synthase complex subunit alpha [Methanosarcina sp. 795]BAW29145.1 acetyl-CoA decarbonylase/synthase complex subunit alpha [Methanosarcina thermophila]HOA69572.1 CO dehydrogenase/acetyl-CoA synthase complex subunit alpha [Methanosarcina thermophila]HPZ20768.1 CO dehydrogenase/acetyl-CoA synthase complex subunit alpha [Methanosarcina thermophila]HQD95051.1 CO dehydrogenase/acetyl-CoA synthase complex subunit alpha [Methanosarcina thermophila]
MSKLTTGSFSIEDLESVQITINNIVGAAKEAAEKAEEELGPMGPTPFPTAATVRDWSFTLFDRYEPVYTPMCDQCCYCTFGPCNLEGNRRGACGLDMKGQAAREFFLRCITGCACHSAHGRHLLDHIISIFGEDMPINMGASNVIAPNIQLVTGRQPKTLGDLKPIMEYVEEELGQLLATVHAGQEGAAIDYDNKAMLAGALDHVGMEVSDIAQVTALGFPKSDPEAPLVEIGIGTLDASKPVIIAIGHNVAGVTYIMDYMEDNNLTDKLEIGGLCCTAFDMTRYKREDRKAPYAKIVGTISKELKVVRSGIPDVIVIDEQCVRADLVEEGQKLKIPVIATNEKVMYGLPDRTNDSVDAIIEDIKSEKIPGCVMLDYEKLGELIPRLAMEMAPLREGISAIPSDEEMASLVAKCVACGECALACPEELDIPDAIQAAKEGDFTALDYIHDLCVGCRRCEQVCNKDIPVLSVIEKAAQKAIAEEKGLVRAGRGQVSDAEIRAEGLNLVMGTTPGVVAIIGCANYPAGSKDVYNIAEEFLSRNYIVAVSGCSAMDIGMYKDEDGKTLYERFPGRFERGNILNTGSCVSNAHISGTAHKVAGIFAQRNLSGNLAEIADYTLNRVGAVGLAWGAYSQKAAAIGTGCNMFGIPAVLGPHSGKYRRALIAKTYDENKWKVYDSRNGSELAIPPAPEFLITTAETWQEACVMIAKNCIRPSDNNMGRSIKLTHWIELSEKYLGVMPEDWWKFVRHEADLPLSRREELLKKLEAEHGWEIDWKKKKIISGPKIKFDVSSQPTNLKRLCKEA